MVLATRFLPLTVVRMFYGVHWHIFFFSWHSLCCRMFNVCFPDGMWVGVFFYVSLVFCSMTSTELPWKISASRTPCCHVLIFSSSFLTRYNHQQLVVGCILGGEGSFCLYSIYNYYFIYHFQAENKLACGRRSCCFLLVNPFRHSVSSTLNCKNNRPFLSCTMQVQCFVWICCVYSSIVNHSVLSSCIDSLFCAWIDCFIMTNTIS